MAGFGGVVSAPEAAMASGLGFGVDGAKHREVRWTGRGRFAADVCGCGFEVRERGGPGGLEQGAVVWRERSPSGFAGGGGEEVEFFAGAGAGDVEEAFAFGGFAGGADALSHLLSLSGSAPLPQMGARMTWATSSAAAVEFEPVEEVGRCGWRRGVRARGRGRRPTPGPWRGGW